MINLNVDNHSEIGMHLSSAFPGRETPGLPGGKSAKI